jgi:hypothetical protein
MQMMTNTIVKADFFMMTHLTDMALSSVASASWIAAESLAHFGPEFFSLFLRHLRVSLSGFLHPGPDSIPLRFRHL